MLLPQGIMIFGANGGGKTTLGREVARMLGVKHMDIEAYHFAPSDIPYAVKRSREECVERMLSDIERYRSFVLTSVTGDFGEVIPTYYRLAVWVKAPKDVRMERIRWRAFNAHGERVCQGGDMYEENERFMAFAASRDLTKIDRWAETLTCPVMHVDGLADWRENAQNIANCFIKMRDSQ